MNSKNHKRYVILDRDGTLNVEKNYLSSADEVIILPGVVDGLKRMRQMGLGLVVVTNQSAIGRGHFDLDRLDAIHGRLIQLLDKGGVRLDGIYFCPHTPEDNCDCRKPKTGLVDKASRELGFDPADSFVIGDNLCDIELGQRLCATTILVQTGYGSTIAENDSLNPDFVAADLTDAALIIERALAENGSAL